MSNQQQITSNGLNDHFASPTFTKSVKVGSPERWPINFCDCS